MDSDQNGEHRKPFRPPVFHIKKKKDRKKTCTNKMQIEASDVCLFCFVLKYFSKVRQGRVPIPPLLQPQRAAWLKLATSWRPLSSPNFTGLQRLKEMINSAQSWAHRKLLNNSQCSSYSQKDRISSNMWPPQSGLNHMKSGWSHCSPQRLPSPPGPRTLEALAPGIS